MALTTNFNYLQPTGFKISISRENYPNLEFFAQGVLHPGMSTTQTEIPYRRANARLPGDKLNFDNVSLTIIADEDLTSYIEMANWMERIVEINNIVPTRRNLAAIPSVSDMRVSILTSHNNVNKTILYKNAFPTNISSIQLEASTSDVTFTTFTVDFAYDYWEFI